MVQQLPEVEEILEYLGLESGIESGPGDGQRSDSPVRPAVTLTWAQSLDGSIAAGRGVRTRLSGDASMYLTHRLRAVHDAILVGIGTVLSDAPRLTTRLCDGADPVPVILDSHLRCPPDAPLFDRSSAASVIVWSGAGDDAGCAGRRRALEEQGARLVDGDPMDLPGVLGALSEFGLYSVMVEGGGRVISSFLAAQLVDRLVVTVVPRIMGGYGFSGSSGDEGRDAMEFACSRWWNLEDDAVIAGRVRWR